MKNRIVKGLVPFGMFALAIAGTFMTTSMGSADALAIVPGYIQTGNPLAPCQQTQISCDTDVHTEFCRMGSTRLYQLTAPNSCAAPLWKVD
ncbi:MAG: hypothetical protein DI539_11675 [Flavobacterium psychrophilum]|nr:MAG: hypothetical protein DI539_11675 [Flavobacterium psychrophilum]